MAWNITYWCLEEITDLKLPLPAVFWRLFEKILLVFLCNCIPPPPKVLTRLGQLCGCDGSQIINDKHFPSDFFSSYGRGEQEFYTNNCRIIVPFMFMIFNSSDSHCIKFVRYTLSTIATFVKWCIDIHIL
jgi:hypothetical protein